MGQEIEAKFRVDSFTHVQRALHGAGATYRGTVLQTDMFFDTADHRFRSSDRGLRIRDTKYLKSAGADLREDDRPLLTFKGPREGNLRAKVRQEIQTRVDDLDSAVQIMLACGLERKMTLQKKRGTYKLGRALVELDTLPAIGRFVEIEGPNQSVIDEVAATLKLQGPPESSSYAAMLAQHCRQNGLPEANATFADFGLTVTPYH